MYIINIGKLSLTMGGKNVFQIRGEGSSTWPWEGK